MQKFSRIKHGFFRFAWVFVFLIGNLASINARGDWVPTEAENDKYISEMERELRDAFRLYDKEGNGYIPNPALKKILDELNRELDPGELEIMMSDA